MSGMDEAVNQLVKRSGLNERQMKAVKSNPKLENLLRQISVHLAHSGSSLRVEKLVEEVNEKMRSAKARYLQKSIIYEDIRTIVLTARQHQESNALSPSSDIDGHQFPVLRRMLAITSAKAKVGSNSQIKLLDDRDFPSLKVPNNEMVDMQHALKYSLQEKGEHLAQFYKWITTEDDEEPNPERCPVELSDLPSIVGAMQKRLKETRARVESIAEMRQSQILNHWRLLSKDATLLTSLAELIRANNHDENKFRYLTNKLEVFMLKIRVFTLDVETKTYSAKVVQAHQIISQMMQNALEEATTKRMVCWQQLSVYESTSPEFKALVEEHLHILRKTEECEWQLMKVKESANKLPFNEIQ